MEENLNETLSENIDPARVTLPMVALRGKVVFPGVSATFDVGRAMSLQAVRTAGSGMNIFISSQKNGDEEMPGRDDVYNVGVVCQIRQIYKIAQAADNVRVTVQGLYRARIVDFIDNEEFFEVEVERLYESVSVPAELDAAFRVSKDTFAAYSSVSKVPEGLDDIESEDDPATFINTVVYNIRFKVPDKQKILEEDSLTKRLLRLDAMLLYEIEIVSLEKKLAARVRTNIEKNQREYYLREQIRAIHSELGEDEEEIEKLRRRIEEKHMPEEVNKKALSELNKLDKTATSSPEYTVGLNYLDWLLDLPFNEKTTDTEDINKAAEILNADHYGLEKVKERIIEYLAVLKLTGSIRGPILCFVGPPGVGKTSVARSVARALGRKFVRMSLGGIRDEAEIRGHRRTYIGSMPGRIIYAMKEAGTVNPVFLLDEIDKVGADMRGDPASALLEVLDPEQNSTFRDRYLEVDYDLSNVLFITTANTLDTIPAPLLDRMEVVSLSGYTQEEKCAIARNYLIPKQIKANGLTEKDIEIEDSALVKLVEGYTLEAGVRNLEREIGSICRKIATKVASAKRRKKHVIADKDVETLLGAPRYVPDKAFAKDEVGAVTGLAWTSVGGVTLTVECTLMKGKGEILLTGKLGDVMRESAQAAFSYLRSHADRYGIDSAAFAENDVHIHIPEGATPKDGPSAGITLATALLSAFTDKKVKKSIAMTGEITLRGNVLPIGGLKEKSLAAFRIGINDIIIPAGNVKDLEEIPAEIRKKIRFIPVETVDEVFDKAFVEPFQS